MPTWPNKRTGCPRIETVMKLREAKILIVDDEPMLCEIFTSWLTLSGCESVHEASDGEEALAFIQAQPVDVLISDIRMPKMDGLTMVRRLRELGTIIPSIIFVSGFADIDVRQMCEFGVEAFLSKPVQREEFIGRVETAIADRSALWLNPMSPSPRQIVSIEVAEIIHPQNGDQDGLNSLSLGRGGFKIQATGPLALGGVAFICRLPVDTRPSASDLRGEGWVRWFSRADRMAGIEFAYLDPSCRAWVLDEIARNHPISFIPGH
jgi:CheY-like chemotaxis protein